MNAFVANFIGMNNLVEGEVTACTADYLDVRGPLGTFKVPYAAPRAVGTSISFVIATDRVALFADDAPTVDGMQMLSATVLGLEFVGSTQTVFVELFGGGEFRVQKQQHEIESLALVPGRKVRLGWDARHAWLLPQTT